jgi:[ribosomal protein S5]-alanine N-acetyltransferase
MRLECANCVVRRWQWTDVDALVRAANNRNVWLQLTDRFLHPYTKDNASAWIDYASKSTNNSEFAIEFDGVAVGGIGNTPGVDIERQNAEVGYWLSEAYWGRGIVTSALFGFCDWMFQAWEYNRLSAKTFSGNMASRRVLEKCGFTLEGVLRQSAIKNGVVLDQAIYARLRSNR